MEPTKETKPKKPATAKPAKATEEPTPMKNDSIFHLPFIAVLLLIAMATVQLVNTGVKNANDGSRLEKLEEKFEGYQSGVKDSR